MCKRGSGKACATLSQQVCGKLLYDCVTRVLMPLVRAKPCPAGQKCEVRCEQALCAGPARQQPTSKGAPSLHAGRHVYPSNTQCVTTSLDWQEAAASWFKPNHIRSGMGTLAPEPAVQQLLRDFYTLRTRRFRSLSVLRLDSLTSPHGHRLAVLLLTSR